MNISIELKCWGPCTSVDFKYTIWAKKYKVLHDMQVVFSWLFEKRNYLWHLHNIPDSVSLPIYQMSHPRASQGMRGHSNISSSENRSDSSGHSPSKHDLQFILNTQAGNASASTPYTPLEGQPGTSGTRGGTSSEPGSSRNRRTKSSDRPFECHICQFSFAQRSDRNKHIRTVHYRERPFMCDYCHQSFGEKGNLYVASISSSNYSLRRVEWNYILVCNILTRTTLWTFLFYVGPLTSLTQCFWSWLLMILHSEISIYEHCTRNLNLSSVRNARANSLFRTACLDTFPWYTEKHGHSTVQNRVATRRLNKRHMQKSTLHRCIKSWNRVSASAVPRLGKIIIWSNIKRRSITWIRNSPHSGIVANLSCQYNLIICQISVDW